MACAVLGIAQLNAAGDGKMENTCSRDGYFTFSQRDVLVVTFAVSLRVTTWLGLSCRLPGVAVTDRLGLLHLELLPSLFKL